MLKFVYGVLPAWIVQSDNMPDFAVGNTVAMVIKMRADYMASDAVVKHELVHVKQFYRTLGLHSILYGAVARYRLYSEAEAYAVQIGEHASEWDIMWAVDSLAANYNLPMDKAYIHAYFLQKLHTLFGRLMP